MNRKLLFRSLSIGVVVALACVLFIDLFVARSMSHLVRDEDDSGAKAYTGTLSLRRIAYDLESRSVTADISATAKGRAAGPDSTATMEFWLSVLRNSDGSVDRISGCVLHEAWTNEKQYAPEVSCPNVILPVREIRRETLYPFDVYGIDLHLRGCIAADLSEGCTQRLDNIDFTHLRVDVGDPTAVVDAEKTSEGVTIVVRRKVFIRGVSVLFGALALLFLLFVARLSKPDDLFKGSLGFFGALWGLRSLIVPASIKVFPTIVDYCIFSLFCLLFAAVLWGLSHVPSNTKEDTHEEDHRRPVDTRDDAVAARTGASGPGEVQPKNPGTGTLDPDNHEGRDAGADVGGRTED